MRKPTSVESIAPGNSWLSVPLLDCTRFGLCVCGRSMFAIVDGLTKNADKASYTYNKGSSRSAD